VRPRCSWPTAHGGLGWMKLDLRQLGWWLEEGAGACGAAPPADGGSTHGRSAWAKAPEPLVRRAATEIVFKSRRIPFAMMALHDRYRKERLSNPYWFHP
jgi:hypothetical protein